jgi:alpha-1,6-mannosyltransferase
VHLKVCDLTQFYSPYSGGVRRYLEEKRRYSRAAGHDHVLIVPGERTEKIEEEHARTYLIRSPLVSKNSRYRALLNLNAVEEILEREQPAILESSDPYQIAWKALASGEALRIPVVAFYHSHFPEAYFRTTVKYLGETATHVAMEIAKNYVRSLYNRFICTFVPSEGLGHMLRGWGVENVILTELGVCTEVFRRCPDKFVTRIALEIPADRLLLLYVGRLAPEKNVRTLFQAFEVLSENDHDKFHLMVVGDGPLRDQLIELRKKTGAVSWLRYCSDQEGLARIYRAADLFVHPSVQETFGLVALESQACGTPVVGIRGSYMDRIIFADQSHWTSENSALSLASAIAATATTDLERAGIEASRRVAKRYSWEHVFTRMFDIYSKIRR